MTAVQDANELLDLFKKAKGVFEAAQPETQRPTEDEKKEILKISIREQSRMYKITSNIYDQLRIKALALIAGEVTILTALFSGWHVRATLKGGDDRVFFFCTGIVFVSLAFGILLWIISTVPWKLAHNHDKADMAFSDTNRNTTVSFLKELHDDYCTVNTYCGKIVSDKCTKFNWTIFLLAAGVIILMVIKFGGPQ